MGTTRRDAMTAAAALGMRHTRAAVVREKI